MAIGLTPGGSVALGDTQPLVQGVIVLSTPPQTSQPPPGVVAFTNRSGTITTGGSSQTLAEAMAGRWRIIIQNPGTSASQGITLAESLFINFTAAAALVGGGSIELLPGVIFDSGIGPVSPELITVTAATTGHNYTAKEQ